jgi:hypothetical protein
MIASHDSAFILQSHVGIGFDHTAIMQAMNVTLPIDRVGELVDKGIVENLAQNYYSSMGAIRNPKPLIEITGPEVARRLKDEGVDLVFIIPLPDRSARTPCVCWHASSKKPASPP